MARELCWEAEWRGAVGQPALAGACAVHCSSLPPLFPRFKHRLCQLQEGTSVPQAGSRSRYLPGGAWQPWRRLKGRRTRVFCLSASLCMAMLTPLTSLPRTNTRVLLVRKKTEQLWPAARFLLFCPNYCVASCAEIGFSGFRA